MRGDPSTVVTVLDGPHPRMPSRLVDVAIALAILVVGTFSMLCRPAGSPVAAWWPAAGLSTWLVMRQRDRRTGLAALGVVLAASVTGNLVAGRPLPLVALLGLANALETATVSYAVSRGRPVRRIASIADFGRLLGAALLGAAVLAVLAAIVLPWLTTATWFQLAASVLAAHLSGQLLVLSVVLSGPDHPALRRPWARQVPTALGVLAATAGIFALRSDSLTFVPLALLVASTFVLSQRCVAATALAMATYLALLSVTPWRPFGDDAALGPAGSAAALQLFLVCVIGLATPLAVAIGDRDRALIAQRETAARLLEAARTRTDLLNAVTHELRTPLTTILGYTEVLSSGGVGELTAEQARVAGVMDRNGRRLLGLVDDLLDVAGVRSSSARTARRAVDLAVVVERAMHQVASPDRTVVFTRAAAVAGPVRLRGDADDLQRSVEHLITNACHASPPSAPVEVELAVDAAGLAVVTVRDHGRGMAPGEVERVCEPFFRTEASQHGVWPGVGLGLTFARRTALAHGGALVVRSEEGAGTEVRLSLPMIGIGERGARMPLSAAVPTPR